MAVEAPVKQSAVRETTSRIIVLGLRLSALSLAFVSQVVLARIMNLESFGAVSTALALLNIVVIPASLGYQTTAIRFVALARHDLPLLRSLTLRFVRPVFKASAITCVAIGAVAVVVGLAGSDAPATAIGLLVLTVPSYALVLVGEGWLRGFGSLVRALVNSGVVVPVVSTVLLILDWQLFQHGDNVGIVAAMTTRGIGTLLALVMVSAFVWSKLDRRIAPNQDLEVGLLDEIHRASLSFCLIGLLSMVLSQAGIVAVSVFEGSAQAGIYSAAVRVSQATGVALITVNFILAPRVARMYAEGKFERLQQQVSSASAWSTCLILLACAVVVPGSAIVLRLFGDDFGSGAACLQILMIGQLGNALTGPVGVVLQMTGRQDQALRALIYAVSIDLALFCVLIPLLGINGAAWATALCTAGQNIGMFFYVKRDLGIWALPGPLVRILDRP
jgi:O-antigen/teichoic acid export membrane protein